MPHAWPRNCRLDNIYCTEWATQLVRNPKRRSARREITQEEKNSGNYQPSDLNLHLEPRLGATRGHGGWLYNYTSGPRGKKALIASKMAPKQPS